MRWVKGQSGRKRGTVVQPTDVPERGTITLDQMDQRVRAVKAMQHDLSALHSDLGGASNISLMEKILCEKIVHLKRLTGKKEELMLADQPIDEQTYVNAVMCLSSLLMKIGLKRRARKIQSLDEYLKRTPEQQLAPLTGHEPITGKDDNDGNTKIDQRP